MSVCGTVEGSSTTSGYNLTHLLLSPLVVFSVVLSSLVSVPAAFQTLFGASWGASWRPLGGLRGAPGGLRGLPGRVWGPWAAPGPFLDPSGAVPAPLLGASWASGRLLGVSSGLWGFSWASVLASWAALGSRRRLFTKPSKSIGFHRFCKGLRGSGKPPVASWGPLGVPWGLWAALGRLLGRPK